MQHKHPRNGKIAVGTMYRTRLRPTVWRILSHIQASPSAETEEADGDVLLLDDEDGNPAEIIGADIEKDDT